MTGKGNYGDKLKRMFLSNKTKFFQIKLKVFLKKLDLLKVGKHSDKRFLI